MCTICYQCAVSTLKSKQSYRHESFWYCILSPASVYMSNTKHFSFKDHQETPGIQKISGSNIRPDAENLALQLFSLTL